MGASDKRKTGTYYFLSLSSWKTGMVLRALGNDDMQQQARDAHKDLAAPLEIITGSYRTVSPSNEVNIFTILNSILAFLRLRRKP